MAAALLSNEHTFRMRVAEYLLESLLGADPLALPELAAEVRRRAGGREGAAGLWALLVITEKGRAKGWGGGTGLVGLLHEEGGEGQGRAVVGLGEVRAAALSAEHELRMAALRVLVTSHRSTETLRPQEQALMTEVRSWTVGKQTTRADQGACLSDAWHGRSCRSCLRRRPAHTATRSSARCGRGACVMLRHSACAAAAAVAAAARAAVGARSMPRGPWMGRCSRPHHRSWGR